MKRRGSSARWLQEHRSDPYVQKAHKEGRVARSAYKLIEVDERDRLLQPGGLVVDLGAAPGGWSVYAAERVGKKGCVIALDLLEVNAPASVEVILGDFREQAVLEELLTALDGRPVDVVLSDMAPNFSGLRAVDQPRSMDLAELALDLAGKVLAPDGHFLVKTFHGEGFDGYIKTMRATFRKVETRKPDASRSRSRETYLLATGLKHDSAGDGRMP
jgi:23S rRNA (uridine2552-2'-O)-methyltransferase